MEESTVYIDYYFRSDRFPWDILGLTVPRVGNVHSNLCVVMANYDSPQAYFLRSRPTLRELKRFAEEEGGTAADIYTYSNRFSDSEQSLEKLVLNFLEGNAEFTKMFQKRMNVLWADKRIYVPEVARRIS